MQRSVRTLAVGALLMLGLPGCGGSSAKSTSPSSTTATSGARAATSGLHTQTAKGDPPSSPEAETSFHVSSSVFQAGRALGEEHAIPARYTCDGANASPPIRWHGAPVSSAELVLLVMNLTESSGNNRVFAWAVAGLKPTPDGVLAAAHLPTSAVLGRNGFGEDGYSVCPSKGNTDHYFVILYALPEKLSLRRGFDPNAVYEQIGGAHLPQGQSGFLYKRA
jgi:phosphatidylethanolamine-binding protein (PEBP) family uncharacterized protein